MKTIRKKVMIVDDDREFLDQFEEMLNLSGYDTQTYSSGIEALENVLTISPDIIVLDLKMDGKDGFEVAKEIKRSPGTNAIPIIAITGYPEERTRLGEAPAIRKFLIKPVNPLNIIAEIEKIVR